MCTTKNERKKINLKQIEQILLAQNEYVRDLIASLPIPASSVRDDQNIAEPNRSPEEKPQVPNGTSRATSLEELRNRLNAVRSKKKLSYKEKLVKKNLKNQLKKKTKRDERNAKKKLVRAAKLAEVKTEGDVDNVQATKASKPIFNSEGKMVFSKFDFSELGNKHEGRTEKDPKKILKTLEKQKEKLKDLESKGETEKAIEIKQKLAWKNAMAKAEGQKIKDDPLLLKKSIKKREQLKNTSRKKWKARETGVQKAQDERQKKREENIAKRKNEKKAKKVKIAVKRGRIMT